MLKKSTAVSVSVQKERLAANRARAGHHEYYTSRLPDVFCLFKPLLPPLYCGPLSNHPETAAVLQSRYQIDSMLNWVSSLLLVSGIHSASGHGAVTIPPPRQSIDGTLGTCLPSAA